MAMLGRVVRSVLRRVGKTSAPRNSNTLYSCRNWLRSGQGLAVHLQFYRTNSSSTSSNQQSEEQPIAFSKSAAQKHRVRDTLQYDSTRLNSVRTFIICVGVFILILYFGYIREESEAEQKIFELNEIQDNSTLTSKEHNALQIKNHQWKNKKNNFEK